MTQTVTPQHVRRVTFTVEQFLDAIPVADSPERTQVENAVVHWLAAQEPGHAYVVYNHAGLYLHKDGLLHGSYRLQGADLSAWTDGQKIQTIDAAAYRNGGVIVKQGTAGLSLSQPGGLFGRLLGRRRRRRSNNNNNNNNNG